MSKQPNQELHSKTAYLTLADNTLLVRIFSKRSYKRKWSVWGITTSFRLHTTQLCKRTILTSTVGCCYVRKAQNKVIIIRLTQRQLYNYTLLKQRLRKVTAFQKRDKVSSILFVNSLLSILAIFLLSQEHRLLDQTASL